MTFEYVRACLEKDGWPVEVISPVTMRSQFRGERRIFPLFVHLEAPFVTFAVIPYVHVPDELAAAEALAERLLRLNREINMAKFSIDEDGDVILSVEYGLEDLDPSEVRDALDVLSFYAEKHDAELGKLSQAGQALDSDAPPPLATG